MYASRRQLGVPFSGPMDKDSLAQVNPRVHHVIAKSTRICPVRRESPHYKGSLQTPHLYHDRLSYDIDWSDEGGCPASQLLCPSSTRDCLRDIDDMGVCSRTRVRQHISNHDMG